MPVKSLAESGSLANSLSHGRFCEDCARGDQTVTVHVPLYLPHSLQKGGSMLSPCLRELTVLDEPFENAGGRLAWQLREKKRTEGNRLKRNRLTFLYS